MVQWGAVECCSAPVAAVPFGLVPSSVSTIVCAVVPVVAVEVRVAHVTTITTVVVVASGLWFWFAAGCLVGV